MTQLLIKAVKILFRLISRYGKGNLISKTAELKLQFFKFSTSKKHLAVRICRDNSQWQLFGGICKVEEQDFVAWGRKAANNAGIEYTTDLEQA